MEHISSVVNLGLGDSLPSLPSNAFVPPRFSPLVNISHTLNHGQFLNKNNFIHIASIPHANVPEDTNQFQPISLKLEAITFSYQTPHIISETLSTR